LPPPPPLPLLREDGWVEGKNGDFYRIFFFLTSLSSSAQTRKGRFFGFFFPFFFPPFPPFTGGGGGEGGIMGKQLVVLTLFFFPLSLFSPPPLSYLEVLPNSFPSLTFPFSTPPSFGWETRVIDNLESLFFSSPFHSTNRYEASFPPSSGFSLSFPPLSFFFFHAPLFKILHLIGGTFSPPPLWSFFLFSPCWLSD